MMPPSTKRHEDFWTKFSNSGHSSTFVRMSEAAEAAEVLRSNSLYDVVVCASRISLYSLYHVHCKCLQGITGTLRGNCSSGFQIYEDCMYTCNPCNFDIFTLLFAL